MMDRRIARVVARLRQLVCLGALTVALSGLGFSLSVETGAAQPETQPTMQTNFEPATGPQHENLPGGLMMVGAYALLWLLVVGFVVRLGMLHSGTKKDIDRLETAVQGAKKD